MISGTLQINSVRSPFCRSVPLTESQILPLAGWPILAAGASALGYALAIKVLNVPYLGNPWIWLIGVGSGAAGVALAGMLGTRRVLAVPPLQSLRRVG